MMVNESSEESSDFMSIDLFCSVLEFLDDRLLLISLFYKHVWFPRFISFFVWFVR